MSSGHGILIFFYLLIFLITADFREKKIKIIRNYTVVIKQFKNEKNLMYKLRGVFRTLYRNKFMFKDESSELLM